MATQQLLFDIMATSQGVDKTFDGVVGSANNMASRLGDEGNKAAKSMFGPLMAVVGGGSIAAAFGKGIGTAINMDSVTSTMTAGLNLAGPAAAAAGQAAGQMYADGYGDSFESVSAGVAATLSSITGLSGQSQEDIQSVTSKVMDLSSAFGLDVGRAAQVAGQMITSGLAKDGTEAADLLAGSLGRVPVNLREDLLDAVDEYGPFMDTLGIKGADAMGMLVSASDKGMYGIDKTGDALKEFTIRATDMSKATGNAYDALGMNQEDMTNKLLAGGPAAKEAFAQIVGGLSSMTDPVAQSQAALALFGTPLEDLGTSEIPKFLNAIDPMGDSFDTMGGAAGELGEKLHSGPGAAFTELQRTAETTLGEMGAQIIPTLTPILEGLREFAPLIVPIVIGFGLLAGVVMLVNGAMAAYAAGSAIVSAATGIWTGVQWLLNAAIWANPLTWIIVGIVALIAAIVLLVMNWDTVVSFLTQVWGGFVGWFTGVMDGFFSWWNGVWSGFVGWTQGIIGGFLGFWNSIWSAIGSFIAEVWAGIVAVVMAGVHAFVDPIVNGIVGLWNFISSIFTNIGNFIAGVWNWITSLVGNIIKAFVQEHGDEMQAIWNNIVAVFTAIGNFFVGVWNWFVGIITAALQAVWGVVTTVFTTVWGFISGVFTAIGAFFAGVWNWYVGIISAALQAVWGVVSAIFTAVWGFISGVFTAIGGFLGAVWNNIVAVISGAVGAVWGTIVNGFSAAWNFITGIFGQVAGFLGGIWGNIVSGVSGMIGQVGGFFSGLWGTITGALSGAGQWLYNAGRNIVDGLFNGIKSLAGTIGNFFLGLLPGWIVEPFKVALGIHSPSTVFAGFGQNIGEGILVGVGRTQGRIDDRMSSLVTVPEFGVGGGFGSSGTSGGSRGGGSTIDDLIRAIREQRPIQVNGAPGMDEEMLARATAEKIMWRG